jgi:hypothetical protein
VSSTEYWFVGTALHALEDTPKSEFFHVGVRRGDPVAAVYYGLGYDDARGPLKVLRQAGEQGSGAIAFMQWF